MSHNHELNSEQLRANAAEVFGLDVDPSVPTEFEVGLADARSVLESGAAATAVAASGMDEESLARIQAAFDPEAQQDI